MKPEPAPRRSESTRFRDFYAEESTVYHGRRYGTLYGRTFEALHHASLRELSQELTPDLLGLEIACGTGHSTARLAAEGLRLVACDLTPDMMSHARERVASCETPPCFTLADAQSLPFNAESFDFVVSTRFLHLFPMAEQERVLGEAVRVLKPGGRLLVDFDNWSSRWIFSVPYFLYNLIRYRRAAPYSVYNRIGPTVRMIEALGVELLAVHGVGGPLTLLPARWSPDLAILLGRLHRTLPLRLLAEQFMLLGTKR